MMRDALNRKLPALSHRNSIDRLFNTVEAPTDNMVWLENINFKALHEKWAAEEAHDGSL
jgi:hypothetical protein